MKILHLSSEKSWRGGESQIAYLIKDTQDPAFVNEVLCRSGSVFESFCTKSRIPFLTGSFSWPGIIVTALYLRKICSRYSIIHAHTAKAHLLVYLSQIFGMNAPVVVARRVEFRPHDSWFTRKRYEHPNVVRIVCVAERIREVMIEYLDRNIERCVTINSGIDIAKFTDQSSGKSIRAAYGLSEDTYLIGITSALTSEKGHDTFLKVAHKVLQSEPSVHFIIVGKGEREASLRQMARELGIAESVTFTGFRKDIPQILPQFNQFLITSDQEGLSNAVLEAFASKVPVIGTRAGGIPEMVIHGQTGYLAEIGDVDALAKYVFDVIHYPEKARKMVDLAENKVRDFSKSKTAERTYRMYRDILQLSEKQGLKSPVLPSDSSVPFV